MSSLLLLTDQHRYHLYRKDADMYRGFNLLFGIVTHELGRQVMSVDAFVFASGFSTHLKLLVYGQGGSTIFCRLLEEGGFEMPVFVLDANGLQLAM